VEPPNAMVPTHNAAPPVKVERVAGGDAAGPSGVSGVNLQPSCRRLGSFRLAGLDYEGEGWTFFSLARSECLGAQRILWSKVGSALGVFAAVPSVGS
jgi:hypothetical protein